MAKVARTFVRNGARMRANVWTLNLSIVVLAAATIAELRPYLTAVHRWEAALAMALAGVFLLLAVLRTLAQPSRQEGFAALGALGGIVIAASFLAGELLVGPPQRIGAAPGQTYRPPHSAHVALEFPHASAADLRGGRSPAAVDVIVGAQQQSLTVGQELRVHSYVLRCESWPAAFVQAWSDRHVGQTVTQPTGSAFVSPVLQFPSLDKDGLPVDAFAVPALHREVRLKYYPGLPSRGIDIPFVQLEIDEENGGPLFSGVAVNARPVRRAGMELTFNLGTYPVVWMAGAPDPLPYGVGMVMLIAGLLGFVFSLRRKEQIIAKC